MIDRITALIQAAFNAIGKAAGLAVAWLLWPFMAAHGWYRDRNWIIKGPIALVLIFLAGFYGYFVWQTQVWSNFDPDYISRYKLAERTVPPGQELPAANPTAAAGATGAAANTSAPVCQRSAIVDAAADLTDFNVNQNAWISSMLLYRLGFFGMDWDSTPFLDNKASFQRGVNQAVRRTSVELVDTLGRVRGTSGINNNLQEARGNMQFSEYSWYFGLDPFGPKTPTPSYYRAAIRSFQAFNGELVACKAVFDTRADNLIQFIDRIAGDIGSTSAILRERSENYNGGWFDTRADDRFWFAYGQLYGYYGVLSAAGSDFAQVIRERNLTNLWNDTLGQTRAALRIQPAIISNGEESGWIMPSHLATMGFYVLRVRSNLVELRSVLDR
ncbi:MULTISPECIES: DUF2333 family protein [unclassified Rhizobium]|uniref:DUF2333 family protein n=1 Tax=unclassified Rhizobium TaxID=2613769 RepID=UPI0024791CEA|nr:MULTISPECIES: DUF2333 family protein [unclassified Rhizobium]MDH7801593.1 hypothetical protein [Rhizobium sp. AN70]